MAASGPASSSSGGGGEGKISSSRDSGGNGSSTGGGGGGKAPPRAPSESSPSPRTGGGGRGKSEVGRRERTVRRKDSQQETPPPLPQVTLLLQSSPLTQELSRGAWERVGRRGRGKTLWEHWVSEGRGLDREVMQLPLHLGKRTQRGRFVPHIPASHPQAGDLERSQEPWLPAMSSTMR